MPINVYQKGDLVRFPAEFKNYLGVVADPSIVLFKFMKPSGVQTTYTYLTDGELVRESLGNFYVDLPLTDANDWKSLWIGTGLVESAQPGMFTVEGNGFG